MPKNLLNIVHLLSYQTILLRFCPLPPFATIVLRATISVLVTNTVARGNPGPPNGHRLGVVPPAGVQIASTLLTKSKRDGQSHQLQVETVTILVLASPWASSFPGWWGWALPVCVAAQCFSHSLITRVSLAYLTLTHPTDQVEPHGLTKKAPMPGNKH